MYNLRIPFFFFANYNTSGSIQFLQNGEVYFANSNIIDSQICKTCQFNLQIRNENLQYS